MKPPRPCSVDGTWYPSVRKAAASMGTTPNAIYDASHKRGSNSVTVKGHKIVMKGSTESGVAVTEAPPKKPVKNAMRPTQAETIRMDMMTLLVRRFPLSGVWTSESASRRLEGEIDCVVKEALRRSAK